MFTVYIYKIQNLHCPLLTALTIFSNQISHSYNTRRKTDFRNPLFKLSISQNAFSYQGPKNWNELPPGIKNLKCSQKTFSKITKNYIIERSWLINFFTIFHHIIWIFGCRILPLYGAFTLGVKEAGSANYGYLFVNLLSLLCLY